MKDILSIHYGEVALKGAIRSFFEDRLAQNIEVAIRDLLPARVRKLYGRLFLDPDVPVTDWVPIVERLKDIFGVAWYGRGLKVRADWAEIFAAATRLLSPMGQKTFGVRAKKACVVWPDGRTEMCVKLGAHIADTLGWKVDLTNPDVWVLLEIVNGDAIITAEKLPGLKGLPVGVSGRVLTLLSGGIDSPVAAYQMMSRGCRTDMIHFHSMPHTSRASVDKVLDLARALNRFQSSIYVSSVAFAPCQQEIVSATPAKYRVLLYRRMMMRIAERVARRIEAQALVTGESVGQVASQTLPNLASVESVVGLPILRPLIGTDKDDTITIAKRAGTFDISIQPHDDCCSFLLPKKPATHSTPEELDQAEAALDVERLVGEAIGRIELHRFVWGREAKLIE